MCRKCKVQHLGIILDYILLYFVLIPLQIHLVNVYEGLLLPCKFYDMPGIDKHGTIKKEDLDKILDGKIKLDVDVSINLTLTLKTKRNKGFVLFNPIVDTNTNISSYFF